MMAERDARVALHIAVFHAALGAIHEHVSSVVIHPDRRHLRMAVGHDGAQTRERLLVEKLEMFLGDCFGHDKLLLRQDSTRGKFGRDHFALAQPGRDGHRHVFDSPNSTSRFSHPVGLRTKANALGPSWNTDSRGTLTASSAWLITRSTLTLKFGITRLIHAVRTAAGPAPRSRKFPRHPRLRANAVTAVTRAGSSNPGYASN